MTDPSLNDPAVNQWTQSKHVEAYLASLHRIPHRDAGEATLLSEVPPTSKRVLDLGCGNGHLLALVLAHCEDATGVGIDLSDDMLRHATVRFEGDHRIELRQHNMDHSLPDLGQFDAVVSSFAIHHCEDDRKHGLYSEAFDCLLPQGVFCNLEHVASPTERIHRRFLQELDLAPEDEDPTNKLLDVKTQLRWLREIGFEDVDCHWKWRELALMTAHKPAST